MKILSRSFLQKLSFALFALVTALSIIGFGTFGQYPQLLSQFPWAVEIYGRAYQMFAQGHTLLAFLAALFLLVRYTGFRWIAPFFAIYLISFLAELGGTSIGIPFGKYEYQPLLGYKIVDHVPLLVPTSWFVMSMMAYGTCSYFFKNKAWARVLGGALMVTAWDFALDPAMSYTAGYWVWESPGHYYGMPFFNPIGWMITSSIIMIALELLKVHKWITQIPVEKTTHLYLLNALLPFAMLVVSGVWGAALVAAVLILGVIYLLRGLSGRQLSVFPRAANFRN